MIEKIDARYMYELARINRGNDLTMPDSKTMMSLMTAIHSFANRGYVSFETILHTETTIEPEIDYLKNRGFKVYSSRMDMYPLPTAYRIQISWDYKYEKCY